eukprot:UN28259
MVFFSIENPAGFSIKSKASFLTKNTYVWYFLMLKNLPVFRSYRKPVFLTKTSIYGIVFSVEKPAGFLKLLEYQFNKNNLFDHIPTHKWQ